VRVLVCALMLVGASACATTLLLSTRAVEIYKPVEVKVYRVGLVRCRIEIVTATETIVTGMARCRSVPHRVQP
jgi:hypothetical protein